jgi:hypothetical protein
MTRLLAWLPGLLGWLLLLLPPLLQLLGAADASSLS